MYFPYLYARQSEMLAIRGLVNANPQPVAVTPVLEPVSGKTGDLVRCAEALGKVGRAAVLIVNPHQGDFRTGSSADLRKTFEKLFASHASLIPGYLCGTHSKASNVHAFLKTFPKNDKALLYSGPSLSATDLSALGADSRARYHLVVRGLSQAQVALLPKARVALIADYFNKQPRNADYSGQEFFTDAHRTTAGHAGYGDYTVVGSIFEPKGGPAAAVAIHLTYKEPNSGDIWIEHFVSDDVDRQVGDVASKYLQAARHATRATRSRPLEFGQNEAITAVASDARTGHFPGLGKSKERQILHHMLLTNAVLTGTI